MTELDPELLDRSLGPRVLERVVLVAGEALPLLAVRVGRTHPRIGEPPADVRVLVGVDEAGRDVGGAAVDDGGLRRRRSHGVGLADGRDAAAGHEDRPALGVFRAQEQPAGDDGLGRRPGGHVAPARNLHRGRLLPLVSGRPRRHPGIDPDGGSRASHPAASTDRGRRRPEHDEARDTRHDVPEHHDRSPSRDIVRPAITVSRFHAASRILSEPSPRTA